MNELSKKFQKTTTASRESLMQDACVIIDQAQAAAYRSINEILIKRNWLLGMRIQLEVLKEQRAEYGEQIINNLAKELTNKYGKGFISRNLHHFVDFYNKHSDFFHVVNGKPEIVNAVSSQSSKASDKIVNAMSSQSSIAEIFQSLIGKYPIRLSWTHYRIILQENNKEVRDWYEQEGHNPTIGLLLCAETDEDVAHYSVLNGSDQLFAAKYFTYMPTQEELRREIEQQKLFFQMQNKDAK